MVVLAFLPGFLAWIGLGATHIGPSNACALAGCRPRVDKCLPVQSSRPTAVQAAPVVVEAGLMRFIEAQIHQSVTNKEALKNRVSLFENGGERDDAR